MNQFLPGTRLGFLIIFLGCFAAIASMLYMQYVMGLEPCALCVTQRVAMITAGTVALIAFIHNPKAWGRRVYAGLGLASALGGAYIANHHRWLQGLPEDQVPTCGPGLGYLWENFPILDVLKLLLRGDGNCHDVLWSFLGLTIPGWSLVAFICLSGIYLWQLLRQN